MERRREGLGLRAETGERGEKALIKKFKRDGERLNATLLHIQRSIQGR